MRSTRGPKGGFVLGKPNNEITLLEVYESIERPLGTSKCLLEKPICSGKKCILGGFVETINQEVREYLAGTNLADLVNVYEKDITKS